MHKRYTPKDTGGWSVYSIDQYPIFMEALKGAAQVLPLTLTSKYMPRIGETTHHIGSEGVTLAYQCTEHSTGVREVQLDYFGSTSDIRKARQRIRKLESNWHSRSSV